MSQSDKLEAIPLVIFDQKEKIKKFDSTVPIIDDFLHDKALESDRRGYTSTTLVINSKEEVMGFFTLNMATEYFRVEDGHSKYQVPYVNLAYLAVDYRHCDKGYGTRIIKHIYRQLCSVFMIIGFPYVFVNALSDSVEFYKKVGFTMSESDEKTYQEIGARLPKYEMIIKTDDMVNLIS